MLSAFRSGAIRARTIPDLVALAVAAVFSGRTLWPSLYLPVIYPERYPVGDTTAIPAPFHLADSDSR